MDTAILAVFLAAIIVNIVGGMLTIDGLRSRNPDRFESFGSPAAMIGPVAQIGFAAYLFQGNFRRDFAGTGTYTLCWVLLASHVTTLVLIVVMIVRWL